MALVNEKGELSKGFEILLRQVLKMMNFDPELILGQISAIYDLSKRHIAQQDEIIARLTRIEENEQRKSERNLSARLD